MEIVVLAVAGFLVSLLTFFSGFGLGTLLMPVFAIFFPLDVAIALTGIVHFFNNIVKLILLGNKADKGVLLRFGIPAVIGAFIGAQLLMQIDALPPIYHYTVSGRVFYITIIKFTVAVLLLFFALMEVVPALKNIQFNKNRMVAGGLLSGFFGGISGIQGALRSAFLVKAGLSKDAFISTGIVIACVVDISRISVYSQRYINSGIGQNINLIVIATLAAILGAITGNILLKKVTIHFIQNSVTVMLILVAIALGFGLI